MGSHPINAGLRRAAAPVLRFLCGLCLLPWLAAAAEPWTVLTTNSFPGESLFRHGPVETHVGLVGGVLYDDNIFIRPDKESDVIWTVSPELSLGLGDYRAREGNLLAVEYSPSFIFFTKNSHNNTIDERAVLSGQWRPAIWTFGLSQRYLKLSDPVIDVGNRVDRSLYLTDLAAICEVSPKTSVEVDGHQAINVFEGFPGYNEWEADAWFDYHITPLVRIGAGGTAGFWDVQDSVNQTYQRALLRAAYAVTELVELRGSAGAEWRQFQEGQPNRLEGIFALGATYHPWENTSFLLDAYRRPQVSIVLPDQNFTLTGVSGTVRQIFREFYAVTLSGGYEFSDYTATSPGVNANRRDHFFFVRPGLDWTIRERLTVTLFYMYRQDNSNVASFDFNNNQAGLALAVRF